MTTQWIYQDNYHDLALLRLQHRSASLLTLAMATDERGQTWGRHDEAWGFDGYGLGWLCHIYMILYVLYT